MKIIVWLWNPWDKYKYTKHNVWFLFLDYLKEKNKFDDFYFESKFKAEISTWNIDWEKIILVKPQTFMNLSWEAVKKIYDYYKLEKENIIIIYDDMSMDFWKIRYREKWSAWWHNWVKSMINYFWDEFKRIKVWIWYNEKFEVSDWVLSRFSEEELIDLDNEIYEETFKILKEKI